jgi:hypothetical protein
MSVHARPLTRYTILRYIEVRTPTKTDEVQESKTRFDFRVSMS